MKEADQEKCLGDTIHKSGNIDETIEKRKNKGEGIIAEILSIISDIPLGKHKIEVALKLREAMLINGILYNSEAWHGVKDAHIVKLEQLDNSLLGILKAHCKTPIEFLHLETGTVPLRWIISQRRINYLRHMLSRSNEELIKKVFLDQREKSSKGDFAQLVEKDLKDFGISYENISSGVITKKV